MPNLNDTPPRASTVSTTASAAATRMENVAAAVNKDLHQSVVVSSGSFFLETILHDLLSVKTDDVARAVKRTHYDEGQKRWKDFPVSENDESAFYPKFVELANVIHQKASRHVQSSDNTISGKWVDCHSKAPNANADFVAEIRPDCAFVTDEATVDNAIRKYVAGKRPRSDSTEEPAPENKILEISDIWWRQMGVVVEVKRKNHHPAALPQLCNYIRQVFKQQLDQRFCLGITISLKTIAMWLCDRSGALGMSRTYNIHSEPNEFIRMICAVTFLPSHRLGWDPTLELYNVGSGHFEPSYAVRAGLNSTRSTTSKTADYDVSTSKWRLTLMDNQNKSLTPEKKLIILAGKPLLVRTAEGMNGRAVQVHQGYREKDEDKQRRLPLVIKSSWQPTSKIFHDPSDGRYMSHEAHMYSLIPVFRERLYAASIVRAGDGLNSEDDTPVTTLGYIRQKAQADFTAGGRMNKEVQTFKPVTSLTDISETKETMAFMAFGGPSSTVNQMYFATQLSQITDRVQTRIALNIWGWPVKCFTNLKELLTVIKYAIIDHETMHKCGVLHRDVSAGNILIRPGPPDSKNAHLSLPELVSKTEGRLIDLDHAKHVEKTMAIFPTRAPDLKESHVAVVCDNYPVTRNTAVHALKLGVLHDALSYCAKAIASNVLGSTPNGEWTLADLGWERVEAVPDYASHTSIVNERTGTIPFISHKLMANDDSVVHNAIHDLESFWWVIIYLCLTRESGGGHRRRNTPADVQDLVDNLFHKIPSIIGQKKALYFGKIGTERFTALSKLFSDYFKPLELMLERWRSVLVLGYNHEAYEYHLIHKYVLAIIEDALNKLPDTKPEEIPIIQDELRRREEEYAFICNIDRSNPGGSPRSTSILVGPNGMSPPRPERVQATPGPSNSRPNLQPPSTPTPVPQVNKKARHGH